MSNNSITIGSAAAATTLYAASSSRTAAATTVIDKHSNDDDCVDFWFDDTATVKASNKSQKDAHCQTRCLDSQSASSITSKDSAAPRPDAASNSAKEATPLFDATTGTAQSLSELVQTVGEAAAAFSEYVDDTLQELTLVRMTGTYIDTTESSTSNSGGGTDSQSAYSNESNVSSPSLRGSRAIGTAHSTDTHAVIYIQPRAAGRTSTSNRMTTPHVASNTGPHNYRRPLPRLDHRSEIPFGNDGTEATPSNRGGYGTFGSTTTSKTLPDRMFAPTDEWESVMRQQNTTLQEQIIALRRKYDTLKLAIPVTFAFLLLAYLFFLAWVSP